MLLALFITLGLNNKKNNNIMSLLGKKGIMMKCNKGGVRTSHDIYIVNMYITLKYIEGPWFWANTICLHQKGWGGWRGEGGGGVRGVEDIDI